MQQLLTFAQGFLRHSQGLSGCESECGSIDVFFAPVLVGKRTSSV